MIASLNPVFQAAGNNTTMGWLLGLTTVLFMSAFLGWTWWVFRPANQAALEAASLMPLEDDDPSPARSGGAR